MLFDTHCHLDAPPLGDDVEGALSRARDRGVTRVLVPGVEPRQWPTLAALAERHASVSIAIGIHPQCLPELADADLADGLADLAAAARLYGAVAIGECGFDGAIAKESGVSLVRQSEIVRAHVEVADALGLPLVVHVLDAMGHALAFFEALGPRPHGAVLHAFGGPAALVPRWSALGFFFGIGPSITWPRAKRPKEAARVVPIERLLLETDAPGTYVHGSPSRTGEPGQLVAVLDALVTLRDEPSEVLVTSIGANAVRLFGP
ncbi:MAG: TatD family hydrolase [Deltaproteobacteria bacterium]|nr:TatD family hydrolase [Deltaproteobacteria bacterium]